MKKYFALATCIALVTLVATSCFGEINKYHFHVKDGKLRRGLKTWTLQGITVPDLAKPGNRLAEIAPAINHISEAGGDSVCFDLPGVSDDGAQISDEALKTLDYAIGQITWRGMGVLCRVFGEGASEDMAVRKAIIDTVASKLGKEARMVYVVDGPGAAKLAALLKKKAPALVVAAEKGGDVQLVDQVPAELPDQPVLLAGTITPRELLETVSCLLPAGDASYEAFEKASTPPAQAKPWTPDNSVLSEEERNDGWIALFDGKSLDGWWIAGSNQNSFCVKDGAIEWAQPGGSMLLTHDRYDDFILRLQWKIEQDGNSGIFLHAPRTNRASKIGMEFQLRGIYRQEPEEHTTGAVYDVVKPLCSSDNPVGEWNDLEITFKGPHLKAVLNGQVVQDVNFDENEELKYRLRRGFIGLQDHGCYAAFRNIRIKKL